MIRDFPPEVVAVISTPVRIDGIAQMTKGLEKMYGKGLVIRYDLHRHGEMVFARPQKEPDAAAEDR